jgi:hypothetical protein
MHASKQFCRILNAIDPPRSPFQILDMSVRTLCMVRRRCQEPGKEPQRRFRSWSFPITLDEGFSIFETMLKEMIYLLDRMVRGVDASDTSRI